MPGLSAGNLKRWLTTVFVILAVVLLFFSFLPLLAEKYLLPEILPPQIAEQYRISIYRLGLKGCTLKISGKPAPGLFITTGNIRIGWTLSGLRERRLDLLVLDGLQLQFSEPSRGKIFAAASSTATSIDKVSSGGNDPVDPFPPLVVDAIKVLNSTITIKYHQRSRSFPFALAGRRMNENQPGNGDILRYSFLVSFAAQQIAGELTYRNREQTLSGTVKTDLDLNLLSRELRDFMTPALEITGIAETSISAEAGFSPLSLERLEGSARFKKFLFRNNKVLFRSDNDNPALLSMSGSQESIRVETGGLVLASPLQASVRLAGAVSFPDNGVAWQGDLQVQPVAEQQVARNYILSQAPPIELHINGEYQDDAVRLHINSIDREGTESEPFAMRHGETLFRAGRLDIESRLLYTSKDEKSSLDSTLLLKGDGLMVSSPEVVLHVPSLELDGKGLLESPAKNRDFSFSGELHLVDGSLRMDRQELSLQGIQLNAPLAWPAGEGQKEGTFQIGNIFLRDIELGNLSMALSQVTDRIEITGKMNSSLIPEGEITINGSFHMPDTINSLADLRFSAAKMAIAPENFSPFFPAAGSFSGSGQLNMEGQVTVYRDRTAGFLALGVHDGFLEIPGMQTRAEGINVQVEFPGLPSLNTSPRQELSIERMSSKKLLLADIKSSFRMESPESFFVEKIAAGWSGGRIFTSSFRLQKENPDVEVALLCDRLDLAEVLTQLGLARAEGEGKVSGRIPLLYEKGNFYVDDGFLFSTPGETGTLKILQSEQLTQGIPEDVPHFSPIHFAGAALKDFQYNWAKLVVSSEGENLLLRLQIDGKPAEILPYRFDTKQNIFVKLSEGEVGGIDQPIKLDVNFNVPLNELLRYNKEIQSIFHNTR